MPYTVRGIRILISEAAQQIEVEYLEPTSAAWEVDDVNVGRAAAVPRMSLEKW